MLQDAGGDGHGLEVVRKFWEARFPYEEQTAVAADETS